MSAVEQVAFAQPRAGTGPEAGNEPVALSKYEGLGNDFLVIVDLEGRRPIDGDLARRACDRHRGFGADGLVRAGPPAGGAAMTFELRNADGSEADMSGNGLRCMVHAAIDADAVRARGGDGLSVLTPAGLRQVQILDIEEGWMRASTEMGVPEISSAPAALCNVGNGQLLVDVGNSHLVIVGGDPAGIEVASLGPHLSDFGGKPRNVEFVTLGPGRDELTIRVWERGVGETQACGTGSVAAAAALHYWGRVAGPVTVHQPGGSVVVEMRPDGVAVLTGTSRRVGRCWLESAR